MHWLWSQHSTGTKHLVDSDDWDTVRVQYGKVFWLGFDGMYIGIAYTPDYQEQTFKTFEEAQAWVMLMAKLTRN